MAKLKKTSLPGVYRRHVRDCKGKGRCNCPYVIVSEHRGRQTTETVATFGEARERKGEKEAGDRRPVSKVRFGSYFEGWIKSYSGRTSRGFSETTRPEYERPIRTHALERWGNWKLAEVEPADVRERFGEMRAAGCSTSQIKKLRATLSAMFATAVDDGLLRANPCQGVRIPAEQDDGEPEEERAKALTRAELARLMESIPEEWNLFFEFLTVTGLRISEAIGLRWEHLRLGETPRVEVREQFYRGKRRKLKSGAARRDIPLGDEIVARLIAYRRDNSQGPRTPVFASSTGTELIRGKVAERLLTPASIAAGLKIEERVVGKNGKEKDKVRPTVTFHTFRHTCASLLFDDGRNIKQVQEWLGHADPAFTLRTYVHLLDAGVGGGLEFPGSLRHQLALPSVESPRVEGKPDDLVLGTPGAGARREHTWRNSPREAKRGRTIRHWADSCWGSRTSASERGPGVKARSAKRRSRLISPRPVQMWSSSTIDGCRSPAPASITST